MRRLLFNNYIVIINMLKERLFAFKNNILWTYNYKTSKAAYQRLENIIKKECENAMKIDYGL